MSIGSPVKVTEFIYEDSTETRTSRAFVYNENVYPIYEKFVYIGALPNNAAATIPHNIVDFPTSPQLYLKFSGYAYFIASTGVRITLPNTASGISLLAVDPVNIGIQTTTNLSAVDGYVHIEYCKQNDFTPLEKF